MIKQKVLQIKLDIFYKQVIIFIINDSYTMNYLLKQATVYGCCCLILVCALCSNGCKRCETAACFSDRVCDCAEKAKGNMVRLTKCYNKAQELKNHEIPEEYHSEFNTQIVRCFGVAVIEEIVKQRLKK